VQKAKCLDGHTIGATWLLAIASFMMMNLKRLNPIRPLHLGFGVAQTTPNSQPAKKATASASGASLEFNSTEDMTMTKPTPEEIERRIAEHEARINERWQEKADNAAALKSAGGLASNMTLRDAAALKALAATLSENSGGLEAEIADWSYRMADAMLEARKTTGEGEA
jgi:hypothetical protein